MMMNEMRDRTGAMTVTQRLSRIFALAKKTMIAADVRRRMLMKPAVPRATNHAKTVVMGSAPEIRKTLMIASTVRPLTSPANVGAPVLETDASFAGSVPARPRAKRYRANMLARPSIMAIKLVTTRICMDRLSHEPALDWARSKIIPAGFPAASDWMRSTPIAPLMAQVEIM